MVKTIWVHDLTDLDFSISPIEKEKSMKNISKVFLIFLVSFSISLAQDKSANQIRLDTDTQNRLNKMIKSKKSENEATVIKFNEITTQWDNINDLINSKADKDILESRMIQLEKSLSGIRQTVDNNLEAINTVKSELSISTPVMGKKSTPVANSTPASMRSWSQIVQNQNRRSTPSQASEIITEGQNMNVRMQEDVTYLLGSLDKLDGELEKLKAQSAELEENEQEEKLMDTEQSIESMRAQTDAMKEYIKSLLKALKEHHEKQEKAIEQMMKS